MSSKQQTQTNTESTSKLEKLSLGFEYDKTLQQIKHDVRIRALE
jgi:hypothetical protein